MSLDPNYRALLRNNLSGDGPQAPERKKRKKRTSQSPPEESTNDLFIEADSSDSMEFEDVDIKAPSAPAVGSEVTANDGDELEAGSDDFEDLEDIDIDTFLNEPEKQEDSINITIHGKKEEEGTKKTKKRVVIVPKEERHRRKLVHQLYLMAFLAHGATRNKWCNDKTLQKLLLENFPPGLKNHFSPAPRLIDFVKQRHFIEGLQKLVKRWRFRVMAQGLVRKDWGELLVKQELVMRNINPDRFRQTICAMRGSRDLGAQGFVSLLRGYGLNARLVFSLQPPDFRSMTPGKSKDDKPKEEKPKPDEHPKSEFDPVFIPDAKTELLLKVRNSETKSSPRERSKKKFNFPISPYPVFWVEVWNPYLKKWITVDPIVNKSVEVMPMRKKGKFEAAALDPTHQTLYVFAFDKFGGVRDVTRRYTQYYNAKAVKKRIESFSDKDEHWFEQILKAVRRKTKYGLPEIKELQEFILRDQYEGVPNNMTDFKNHPLYALESQLRKDEVIYPNDDTSKCGTFRPMNKDSVVPIIKRSHVFRLRTAKAWYLRGRVLKIGAQPLKTKEKQLSQMEEEDEDGLVRLYAEFQTEVYHAPLIVDGEIPKNAYGNVEIFVPSMMPENGYLIHVSEKLSIKLIEKAARDILKIDHARAIVAFDFTEKNSKNKRAPTARVGGVLVDAQYKEAIDLVIEGLLDLEEDEKRRKVELTALRGWSFFLKKLMIMDRLNRQHGEVEKDPESEEEGYYSLVSDDESGGDEYNAPESRSERFSKKRSNEPAIEEMEDEQFGGFLPQLESPADIPTAITEPTLTQSVKIEPKEETVSDEEGGFFIPEEPNTPDHHTEDVESVEENRTNSVDPPNYTGENGGFFPSVTSEVSHSLKEEEEDVPTEGGEDQVESDISDSASSVGIGEGIYHEDGIEDLGSPQSEKAQNEVSGSTAAKDMESPSKATLKSEETKLEEHAPKTHILDSRAMRTSSTDNKTSSFEEGDLDQELQQQIQEEEEEMGFEYSDSE